VSMSSRAGRGSSYACQFALSGNWTRCSPPPREPVKSNI
jgi:hypothetical protein